MKNVEKEIRESAQMLEEGRLNFGMVQVVYEWARNKVSHEKKNIHTHAKSILSFIWFNLLFTFWFCFNL